MNKLKIMTVALITGLVLVGCGKVEPTTTLTEKNIEKAKALFAPEALEKIKQLGGNSYLVGKTVASVKQTLETDFFTYQKNRLVREAREARSVNLDAAAKKTLRPETVKSSFAKTDNERRVEVNEIRIHNQYINDLNAVNNMSEPLGTVIANRVAIVCNSPETSAMLEKLKGKAKYTREVNRQDSMKECRKIEVSKKRIRGLTYDVLETAVIDGVKVYKARAVLRGGKPAWFSPSELAKVSSPEELAEMKKQQQEKAEKLLTNPPVQFYSALRPLLDISPQNTSRIRLAEKAIALDVIRNKTDWATATKNFVLEQRQFSQEELNCYAQKHCKELEKYQDRMADYILSALPKGTQSKELSCEILPIDGCLKAMEEEKKVEEAQPIQPAPRKRKARAA